MYSTLALEKLASSEIKIAMTDTGQLLREECGDKEASPATSLAIRFEPGTRFLEATWQRSVTDEEYRQGIRFLGLCIAILRAEFMLVNFSNMGTPTPENQRSTADYLQHALKVTTLKRSARVLDRANLQQQMYDAVVKNSPELPYEVKQYYSVEEAKEWLFQDGVPAGNSVLIPLHCSLKVLKKFASADGTKSITNLHQSVKPDDLHRLQTSFMELLTDVPNRFMRLCWLRPVTSREYRYGVLKAGRIAIENQIQKVVVQNQRLGTLTLEDQGWLVTTTIEFISKSAIEQMAVITSADVMQQMASETIKSRIMKSNLPFQSRHFLSESEAMDWLHLPDYN
ncbi:hypothetical protein WG947_09535 [Pontibacter sp. H259]|uniref:hypothetical protein n=1 Tax=Pontibacter sp. H259 TaxID=3133421 RepID=UPI0030C182FB